MVCKTVCAASTAGEESRGERKVGRGKSEQTLHVTVFSVTQRGRELNFMADHHATARMKTSTADEMSQFIYPFKDQA